MESRNPYGSAKEPAIRRRVKRIVVEGCGDVVLKFYEKRLERMKRDHRLSVNFTYDSSYEKNEPRFARKMSGIRSRLYWAELTDIAKTSRSLIRGADIVLVCTPDRTHSEIASYWMQRQDQPIVLVEKPLEANPYRARKLCRLGLNFSDRVGVIDHYRARWVKTREDYTRLQNFFEMAVNSHWLKSFTYYFLEDHSWNDQKFIYGKSPVDIKKQGPIEIENRVAALRSGLMLDLMPYPLDFLDRFADLKTVEIVSVKAGQYTGVNGDQEKRASISNETFAEVKILFGTRFSDRPSEGTIYVGKGIGGVRKLRVRGDIRIAVLEGTNGTIAEFDFESLHLGLKSKTGEKVIMNLQDFTDAFYRSLLARVIDWKRGPIVSFETAGKAMQIIHQAKRCIPSGKMKIPTYHLSLRGTATPSLEEVLNGLPIPKAKTPPI